MTRTAAESAPAAADRNRGAARFWLAPAAAALLGLICFANSVRNGFVYDDVPIIQLNPRVTSLANLPTIWTTDWWLPTGEEALEPFQKRDRLYRPLVVTTFALEYAAYGLWPAGYHAVNVLLHVAACVLVWVVAQRLFGDDMLSACAALVFAVHPIHCEAVANVVGRAEVLAAVFLLLGLLALLPAGRPAGWKRGAWAAACFLAALTAKETAICYVPVALLVLYWRRGDPPRPLRGWLMHAGLLLLPLLVYLPLRWVALDHHLLRDAPPSYIFNPLTGAEGWNRIIAPFTLIGQYTRLLLFPLRLSSDYGLAIIAPAEGGDGMTALGVGVTLLFVLALVGFGRRSQRWRRLALLAGLSVASYGLISNTVLLIGVSMAERLMYWPSVPMLLLAVAAVLELVRRLGRHLSKEGGVARLTQLAGLLVLAALAVRTYDRNFDWRSNLDLFARDVSTHPRGVTLHRATAIELMNTAETVRDPRVRQELYASADEHLVRALQIYPRDVDAIGILGQVRFLRGNTADAIRLFDAAVRMSPADRDTKKRLAILRGEYAEAEARVAELEAQVAAEPGNVSLRIEVARWLTKAGLEREALTHLEAARQIAPDELDVMRAYAELLALYGEGQRAVPLLKEIVARDPQDWRSHANLSALLGADHPEEALLHAREAQRLNPNVLETNQNLAEALAVAGHIDEAIDQYRLIERGLPPEDPMRAPVSMRIAELEQKRGNHSGGG